MHKKRIRTYRRVESVLQGGAPLRQKMIQLMQERKFSPSTQIMYVRAVNLRLIQSWLGHQSPAITAIWVPCPR